MNFAIIEDIFLTPYLFFEVIELFFDLITVFEFSNI